LTTLKVAVNNIESALNTRQTEPETTCGNQNTTQNTNKPIWIIYKTRGSTLRKQKNLPTPILIDPKPNNKKEKNKTHDISP